MIVRHQAPIVTGGTTPIGENIIIIGQRQTPIVERPHLIISPGTTG